MSRSQSVYLRVCSCQVLPKKRKGRVPTSENPNGEVVYKIIYIGEPVTIALPPEEKAEVAHESGARIVVPAGAVAEETTVSVAEVEPPTGALEVDRAYDFSVGDAELLEPVTVHIPFELDEGQDFSGIYALHWNEDLNDWDPV